MPIVPKGYGSGWGVPGRRPAKPVPVTFTCTHTNCTTQIVIPDPNIIFPQFGISPVTFTCDHCAPLYSWTGGKNPCIHDYFGVKFDANGILDEVYCRQCKVVIWVQMTPFMLTAPSGVKVVEIGKAHPHSTCPNFTRTHSGVNYVVNMWTYGEDVLCTCGAGWFVPNGCSIVQSVAGLLRWMCQTCSHDNTAKDFVCMSPVNLLHPCFGSIPLNPIFQTVTIPPMTPYDAPWTCKFCKAVNPGNSDTCGGRGCPQPDIKQNLGDVKAQTAKVIANQTLCKICSKQLSAYLDVYYGIDPEAARHCSECRYTKKME